MEPEDYEEQVVKLWYTLDDIREGRLPDWAYTEEELEEYDYLVKGLLQDLAERLDKVEGVPYE